MAEEETPIQAPAREPKEETRQSKAPDKDEPKKPYFPFVDDDDDFPFPAPGGPIL